MPKQTSIAVDTNFLLDLERKDDVVVAGHFKTSQSGSNQPATLKRVIHTKAFDG